MMIFVVLILASLSQQQLLLPTHTNETNTGGRRKSNHQGRFLLKNINEARRILASGMLRNIDAVFGLGLPVLGPASNVYRMKWSFNLEDMAAKQLENGLPNGQNELFGDIKMEGYVGFYWLHDINSVVEKYLEGKQIGLFKIVSDSLTKYQPALETFMMIVWAFYKLDSNFPNVKEGSAIGPLVVFFADRYEFGCSFDIYAVCLVRDGQQKQLYKYGVPCNECPTFCEFTENLDGTIDEGDMCVPPTTTKLAPAPLPEFEFDDHSSELNLFLLLAIVLLFLIA